MCDIFPKRKNQWLFSCNDDNLKYIELFLCVRIIPKYSSATQCAAAAAFIGMPRRRMNERRRHLRTFVVDNFGYNNAERDVCAHLRSSSAHRRCWRGGGGGVASIATFAVHSMRAFGCTPEQCKISFDKCNLLCGARLCLSSPSENTRADALHVHVSFRRVIAMLLCALHAVIECMECIVFYSIRAACECVCVLCSHVRTTKSSTSNV